MGENPYQINTMEPFFYTKFLPKIIEMKKDSFDIYDSNYFHNSWIITNNYDDYKFILNNKKCEKIYSSFPEKIINLNKNWKRLKLNWYILYCNNI